MRFGNQLLQWAPPGPTLSVGAEVRHPPARCFVPSWPSTVLTWETTCVRMPIRFEFWGILAASENWFQLVETLSKSRLLDLLPSGKLT
jgi:hypothetical protein